MEKQDRTREDDDEMLHCAHASAYHWHAGRHGGKSRARRVAVLARVRGPRAVLSRHSSHAQRCLEIVEELAGGDGGVRSARRVRGARPRALVAGDRAEARRYAELGREATAKIDDEDDRKIMEADFATIGA